MTTMNAAPAAGETVDHALKRFLAVAATDPGLRRHLLADPRAALAAAGLSVADGVTVSVEETPLADVPAVLSRCTATSLVLPVPTRPDGDLTDGDLDAVSGGGPDTAILEALVLLPTVPLFMFLKHGPSSMPVVSRGLAEGFSKEWNDKSTP